MFHLVFLNGTNSDNVTETFTGFIIYIYNEFEDEESGHFVKPLPAGVSMKECNFKLTSQEVIASFAPFQGHSFPTPTYLLAYFKAL